MTGEEQVAQMIAAPLVIPKTRKERFWDVVQKVCAVVSVVALAVATIGIVLLVQLAICTNNNLGARNQPNVDDRQALALLFSDKPHGALHALADIASATTVSGRFAAFGELEASFATYNATAAADDQIRAEHPIGKC